MKARASWNTWSSTPTATGCSPPAATRDGFLLVCDPAAKKVLAQIKVPMYVHDLALNESSDRAYAVGHHKIALLELKN